MAKFYANSSDFYQLAKCGIQTWKISCPFKKLCFSKPGKWQSEIVPIVRRHLALKLEKSVNKTHKNFEFFRIGGFLIDDFAQLDSLFKKYLNSTSKVTLFLEPMKGSCMKQEPHHTFQLSYGSTTSSRTLHYKSQLKHAQVRWNRGKKAKVLHATLTFDSHELLRVLLLLSMAETVIFWSLTLHFDCLHT